MSATGTLVYGSQEKQPLRSSNKKKACAASVLYQKIPGSEIPDRERTTLGTYFAVTDLPPSCLPSSSGPLLLCANGQSPLYQAVPGSSFRSQYILYKRPIVLASYTGFG